MKANELRLGNYVSRNGFLQEDKETFNKTDIAVSHNDITACVVDSESFQPIPLNEEWLFNLGFIKKNGYGFIKKDLFGNLFYSVETKEHFMFQYYELRIKINYVHQLQNLYFALTGEQLTFKSVR
jgi:hypothetical protein